jgi:hypothetical protein
MTTTKLTRAVAKQIGGMDSLKEIAQDVCNHGADVGFHGFIYYSDTTAFYKKNKAAIIELVAEMAQDLGETAIALVKGFNCLKSSTEEEIATTLYGKPSQHDQTVANALAWFALEEVCRTITDN